MNERSFYKDKYSSDFTGKSDYDGPVVYLKLSVGSDESNEANELSETDD